MEGTDGATTFTDDNSADRSAVGVVGNGSIAIDTAQSYFGGSSCLAPGSADSLLFDGSLIPLSGDFTIESWVRFTGTASRKMLYSQYTTGTGRTSMEIGTDEKASFFCASQSSFIEADRILGDSALSVDTWYHIAVVRDGSTFTMYIDGVAQADTITHSVNVQDQDFEIFGDDFGTHTDDVWQDEFRISNTARYTANFTAPTAPFVNDANTLLLLHMDGTDGSTLFLDDNGAFPLSTEGTAVEFDGTNDYYEATSISTSASDNQYLLFACTFYRDTTTNLQHLFNLRLGTGASDYGFWVWINGGRTQVKMVSGTGSNPTSIYENTENSFTLDDWNQVVVWWNTSDYANSKIFVNGEQKAFSNEGTTSVNWNWGNTATTLKIGELNSSQTTTGADFNGKVSQLYISNPSSFPGIEKFYNTGPLDLGTTGTKTGLASPLIYHYGDTSTFTSNNGTGFASYTLTANGDVTSATADLPQLYNVRHKVGVSALGNAQIDTAQSQYGGSSALFDGTGDYLDCNQPVVPSTLGFTAECWFRTTTSGVRQELFVQYISGVTGRMLCWIGTDNKINAFIGGTGGKTLNGTTVISTNTWYHYAYVVDASGNAYLYLDGNLEASDTGQTIGALQTSDLYIAREYTLNSGFFYGNLDEVRISNTARYTSGFTPTTEPFQNDANTLLLLHMDGTDGDTDFVDDNGKESA
jgi:hypothetical protein